MHWHRRQCRVVQEILKLPSTMLGQCEGGACLDMKIGGHALNTSKALCPVPSIHTERCFEESTCTKDSTSRVNELDVDDTQLLKIKF